MSVERSMQRGRHREAAFAGVAIQGRLAPPFIFTALDCFATLAMTAITHERNGDG
ncbi:MAG: hypothetical protein ACLP7P_03345 [Rhodomicrobium sp.]